MSVIDTLLNWIAPFLGPMQDFSIYANEMNGVHSNSLQSFRQVVYTLDPSQALQQNTIISGEFANALSNTGLDFTQTELDLSEMALEINKLYQLCQYFADCVSSMLDAVATASAEVADDAVIAEVAADVDIAAVAEGGFNPIADILGIILTIIAGAEIIAAIQQLAESIYQDIQGLIGDVKSLQDVIYPETAPQPYLGNIQPGWQTNPKPFDPQDVTALVNQFQASFPGQTITLQTTIENLMKLGLTKDQIAQIINTCLATGCSPSDILLFLQGLLKSDGTSPNTPTPAQIMQRIGELSRGRGTNNQPNLKQVIELYAQIAGIPGAGRLLERLMTAPYANGNVQGYFFELQWCAEHKDQIARIEDVTKDGNSVQQAADVVMKSGPFTKGAIVDTKSWGWPISQDRIDRMLRQVAKDKKDYPGYPIVYVFDSSRGDVPENVIKALTDAGVTVMSSPPDRVLGVGDQNLPGPHTDPARLLQSAANVVATAISTGQSQQPQLPQPQQPQQLPPPPQELPPMELPPQQ